MMGIDPTPQRKIHALARIQGFFIDKRGSISLNVPLRILRVTRVLQTKNLLRFFNFEKLRGGGLLIVFEIKSVILRLLD